MVLKLKVRNLKKKNCGYWWPLKRKYSERSTCVHILLLSVCYSIFFDSKSCKSRQDVFRVKIKIFFEKVISSSNIRCILEYFCGIFSWKGMFFHMTEIQCELTFYLCINSYILRNSKNESFWSYLSMLLEFGVLLVLPGQQCW